MASGQEKSSSTAEWEAILRAGLDASPFPIAIKGLDGRYIQVNAAFARHLGLTINEITGRTIRDLWPRDQAEIHQAKDNDALTCDHTVTYQADDGTLNRSIRETLTYCTAPLKDQRSRTIGIYTTIVGFSDQTQSSEKLRSQTNQLENQVQDITDDLTDARAELAHQFEIKEMVFDNIPAMICLYDSRTDQLKFVNREVERRTGRSQNELLNKLDLMSSFYPDPAYRRQVWRLIERADGEWQDILMTTLDGEIIETSWSFAKLSDGSRIGLGVDISRRKDYERRLWQSTMDLRLLSNQLIDAQEEERHRIAAELHDAVAQSLAAIGMITDTVEEDIEDRKQTPLVLEKLGLLKDSVEAAFGEVETLMSDLAPPPIETDGIFGAIENLIQRFQAGYENLNFETSFETAESEIPERIKLTIFRIIQEGLSNASKHSQGSRIRLVIQTDDSDLILTIEDDGIGFDEAEIRTKRAGERCMGLHSMRERAGFHDGNMTIETAPGRGVRLLFRWPAGLTNA